MKSAAVLLAISVCQWTCHLGEAALLEPNCGMWTQSAYQIRIIGGSDADITSFPWMAYLHDDNRYFCAGTLINHQFVLTAAHCIGAVPKITVRLGGSEITPSATLRCQSQPEDYPVSFIISHKHYNPSIMLNDIALLKLARSVNFEDHIRPICIILEPEIRLLLEDGMSVCSKLYNVPIIQGHICAGDKETNTCNGDSGGPLAGWVNYYGDLRFVQYGVASFGDFACRAPSIYTDLSTYSGWISSVVNRFGT
uniref:GG16934 n=1 Tax=Drosophila erecta TaxID=7220 RepID=B3P3T2_DROER